MKSLRLLVTTDCPRRCQGCCNKQFNLPNLPTFENFDGYDQIMFTGGEPFADSGKVINMLRWCNAARRDNPESQIIVYTALVEQPLRVASFLASTIRNGTCDGITLTLHTQEDGKKMARFDELMQACDVPDGSFRLNVFRGVEYGEVHPRWQVKDGITWIKDRPLPPGEEFKRLPTFI